MGGWGVFIGKIKEFNDGYNSYYIMKISVIMYEMENDVTLL